MTNPDQTAVKDLSFEDALKELETIVAALEAGQTNLEKSIALYDRGTLLRKHCETKLSQAQAKVEKITLSPDGKLKTEPLDE